MQNDIKKKLLIITAILAAEASEKSDEQLQAEIKAKLRPEDIPWAEEIEKVTVLSEG